jgi:drug/metabolite transporter (DMT)-like permease
MEEKRAIDGFGATALIGFATLLAFNQVVIKITGDGFSPVFQAGLRSLGAVVIVLIWIRARKLPMRLPAGVALWGVVSGFLFAAEFVALYLALDFSPVSRASIIFYSMPVWLSFAAHFLLPGERLSPVRASGLILAMAGVGLALSDRSGGPVSLWGDLLSLAAAIGWAAIVLSLRITPLARATPQVQLLFQLAVSAVLLLAAAPFFGDLLRDPGLLHLAGLGFQILFVASFGFLAWFWLMSVYRASGVASFSFLSPVLAVALGWAILGETVGAQIWGALVLVASGIFLINRR